MPHDLARYRAERQQLRNRARPAASLDHTRGRRRGVPDGAAYRIAVEAERVVFRAVGRNLAFVPEAKLHELHGVGVLMPKTAGEISETVVVSRADHSRVDFAEERHVRPMRPEQSGNRRRGAQPLDVPDRVADFRRIDLSAGRAIELDLVQARKGGNVAAMGPGVERTDAHRPASRKRHFAQLSDDLSLVLGDLQGIELKHELPLRPVLQGRGGRF